MIRDGYDIRTVQELLGHEDLTTTMMYTHVLKIVGAGASAAPRIGYPWGPGPVPAVSQRGPR